MFPIERQEQIKQLIQMNKTLRISELSERFNVSEMTIHRDLNPLVEEGLISKFSGGMSLIEKNYQTLSDPNNCVYCYKPNRSNMVYHLILPGGEIESACCAHCGLLRHRQLGQEVSHAICYDFFLNTTISASLTWFVMDTTLNVACCQPQVLTFANGADARKFVNGFGGTVYGFREAMDTVYQQMFEHSECCDDD
ncbi:copper uptake transcriptional regulator YcnK [Barrientosiimonas marina]|uniref:DeoR family transcriptional regulator n=1 Tax=Lentibacillus kimchii TaxID=1542911 RepID=A0ABW2UU41_9BACI